MAYCKSLLALVCLACLAVAARGQELVNPELLDFFYFNPSIDGLASVTMTEEHKLPRETNLTIFVPMPEEHVRGLGAPVNTSLEELQWAQSILYNFVLPEVFYTVDSLLEAGEASTAAGTSVTFEHVDGQVVMYLPTIEGFEGATATVIPIMFPVGQSAVYLVQLPPDEADSPSRRLKSWWHSVTHAVSHAVSTASGAVSVAAGAVSGAVSGAASSVGGSVGAAVEQGMQAVQQSQGLQQVMGAVEGAAGSEEAAVALTVGEDVLLAV